MDIRINDGKADLMECENLTKEELEFILILVNSGEYWELRDSGEHYTLHDKGNYKYKGTLADLQKELLPPKEHIWHED